MEPNAAALDERDRQKEIRYHTRKLREMGADEQSIADLVEKLQTRWKPAEKNHPAAEDPAEPGVTPNPAIRADEPRSCSHGTQEPPRKLPIARGVLGFRIRTAPKKTNSSKKDLPDPPTGAVASATTQPPRKGGPARRKTQG